MRNHDVSLILSTYLSDIYIEQYYQNIVDLLTVANIQLVHILNEPTEPELLFIERFKQLQSIKGLAVFEYKHLIVKRETLYASWNRAIKLSNSKLISISNVDDIRYSHGLRMQIDAFNGADEMLLLGSYSHIRTKNGLQSPSIKQPPNKNELVAGMYGGTFMMWSNPRYLGDPDIFFDEQFKVAGDFDFQIRFASLGRIEILNKYVGEYLNIGTGLSTSSILQEIEAQLIYRRYSIVDKLIPFSSSLCSRYGYFVNSIITDNKLNDISEVELNIDSIRRMNSVRSQTLKVQAWVKAFKINLKSIFYAK
jgi:hypothetical protein